MNRHEVLRDGIYEVNWTVDFAAEEVTFFVTAKTKGFVGFGISYTGSMQHSDIVIGGVFENGTTYFSVNINSHNLHSYGLKISNLVILYVSLLSKIFRNFFSSLGLAR